jgi:hypothetical protein
MPWQLYVLGLFPLAFGRDSCKIVKLLQVALQLDDHVLCVPGGRGGVVCMTGLLLSSITQARWMGHTS